ncbi:MAG: DUF86 domain-containing protein [Oscillospiraceae bacterium]|nr:DUF86 domain-containing protein [Oscillospiraceae bacterium]
MADKYEIIFRKLIGYIDKTLGYCSGATFESFIANDMLVEACVFNLSQMGELVRLYVKELRDSYPSIPWHSMYNLRNRIVHDYDGIDLYMIWDIIQIDLPQLKEKLATCGGA